MAEDVVYKSPASKLVRFFRKSRDQWKEKCQERKRLCRKLSNQVRVVEASRRRWKQEAKDARREVQKARREVEQLRSELEEAKNTRLRGQ